MVSAARLAARARARALSPDGSTLAWSGKKDCSIHLVDIATGKELIHLAGHPKRIRVLAFSSDGRRIVSGSEDTTALTWDVSSLLKEKPALSDAEVVTWDDLRGEDAKRAFVAVRRMSGSPKVVVPFLAKQIQPVPVADANQVVRLVKDLDSDDFAVREKAAEGLAKLGEQAAHLFRKTLSNHPSAEVRRRLESLLEKLAEEANKDPSADKLQKLRAIEVLVRVGTPNAIDILEALTRGAPDAWLTGQAKTALNHLPRQKRSP